VILGQEKGTRPGPCSLFGPHRLRSRSGDTPARGAEIDRVPRVGESLVKDFRPWSLGKVWLSRGRGKLSLHARDIPGRQAIEVRGVALTLLK
jgi:hypothetical protein